jgi:hypothetical protein
MPVPFTVDNARRRLTVTGTYPLTAINRIDATAAPLMPHSKKVPGNGEMVAMTAHPPTRCELVVQVDGEQRAIDLEPIRVVDES